MFILPGFLSIRALALGLTLLSTVLAAPLPMDRLEELMDKIKGEATDIQKEMNFKEEELQMIRKLLEIHPVPLEQCNSGSKTACYTELFNGLESMKSLLSAPRLHTELDLADLLYDLEEFISNLKETMITQGITIPTPVSKTLPSPSNEFQERARIFLILHDLCKALGVFQEAQLQ